LGTAGGQELKPPAILSEQRSGSPAETPPGHDAQAEEVAFLKAMDEYKRVNRRPFPTVIEVLDVLRSLGYRKTAEPTQVPAPPAADAGAKE
jgi:hypothetical protein